ncbi:hypothetical protein [Mycolicibacterium conceptionense]|uniref:hypothetical protein n=1 Tax=Mycolicibacterium conceptionense TaxID=451644 RepID=UPI0007ED160E|nr:hypothetical protein [Mycolicibacterium conceptionense]OBK07262.1 hypothetical protein A5639_15860 [Mycolicibacterium conceptionense]
MTDARELCQQMTAAVHEAWRQHREGDNPAEVVESPVEAEPTIGTGNVIPSAGNQPSQLPTREQLIQLAEQAGDRKLAVELKNELLVEQFEATHGPQAK